MAAKRDDGWKCDGFGSPHGFRKGRLWFACQSCRWSWGSRTEEPKETKESKLERYAKILAAQRKGESHV